MPRTKKLIFSEDLSDPEYLKEINGELYTTDHFSISLKNRFRSVSDYSNWISLCNTEKIPSEFWNNEQVDLEIIKDLDEVYKGMPGFSWNFKELFGSFGKYSENFFIQTRNLNNSYTLALVEKEEWAIYPIHELTNVVPDKLMFLMLSYAEEYLKRTFSYPIFFYNLENLEKNKDRPLVSIDFWRDIDLSVNPIINFKNENDLASKFYKLKTTRRLGGLENNIYWKIKSHIEDIILGEYLIETIVYKYYGRNKQHQRTS